MKNKKKNMTVAELIEKLKEFDGKLEVVVPVFESCVTDAGTELGDDVPRYVEGFYELGDRLEITTSRF